MIVVIHAVCFILSELLLPTWQRDSRNITYIRSLKQWKRPETMKQPQTNILASCCGYIYFIASITTSSGKNNNAHLLFLCLCTFLISFFFFILFSSNTNLAYRVLFLCFKPPSTIAEESVVIMVGGLKHENNTV